MSLRQQRRAIDLPQKLKYLSGLTAISVDRFIDEISNERIIDRRTVQNLLDMNKEASLRTGTREKLLRYWLDKTKINLQSLRVDFYTCTFEEFERAFTEAYKNKSRIYFDLEVKNHGLRDFEVDEICGKYVSYRYSFSSSEAIISEVHTINRDMGKRNQLIVKSYVRPEVRVRREANSIPVFSGFFCRIGVMYYAFTSSDESYSSIQSIRCLHFPAIDWMRSNSFYGLITGFSASHQEPVATRIVAEKINASTVFIESDSKLIRWVEPKDKSVRHVRDLLGAHPANARDGLLMVDHSLLARSLSKGMSHE